LEDHFFGTATVGDRGQVVIPADARKRYNIHPGDKVLVMGDPGGNGVMMCKIDAARKMLAEFLAYVEKLDSEASADERE
jgi:AbrB family looped-hinge helix DNA binding protein